MSTPLFPRSELVAIWDTSSVVHIRERVPRASRADVLRRLLALAGNQQVLLPHQVIEELERFRGASGRRDELAAWARRCERVGASFHPRLELVKGVLRAAPSLIDADAEFEEADPYVLALALERAEIGDRVVVVTNDVRDRPTKMSLSTACGLLGVASVPCLPHLARSEIYSDGRTA